MLDISVKQMKYAVEIAHCGSINQASQNLYVTQSSLSKAILQKEDGVYMEEKTVTLHPVLALHGYAIDFSQAPGKSTYRFCVKSGEIEIHHHSYDGIVGLWCLPPESGDEEVKVLHTGDEAEITFDSRVHNSEPDYIEIANHHYGKRAVFSYSKVEKTA